MPSVSPRPVIAIPADPTAVPPPLGRRPDRSAPNTATAMRVDIFVRPADAPVDPEALSIEGEGVSKLVTAVKSWSSAVQALLGALTSLPPFIRDMTHLIRDTVTQLLQVVTTRGRQFQAAAQDVVKSVRG